MFDTSLFGPRIRLKHLVPFLRQAATMIQAGIDIRQTFDTLARSTPSRTLRRAIQRMSERVDAGDSLEEALEDAGEVFPDMMVRVLSVGETTGNLDRMFRELADYFAWWGRMMRGFLTYLIWPGIILFVLVHVVALLMGLGFIGGNWVVFLLSFYVAVPVLLLLPRVLRTLEVSHTPLDYLLLNLPVIGKHIRTLFLARFSLALEMLLEAGVGMHEALAQAAEATGNEAFVRGIEPAVARILEGEGFADSLSRTGLFPETFLVRMETAEESGAIVEDLKRLADDCAEEARFSIDLIVRLIAYGLYLAILIVGAIVVIMFYARFYGRALSSLTG